MKKNIILSFIILIGLSMYAQDKSKDTINPYAPIKKKFTVALNFGKGAYLNTGMSILNADGSVASDGTYSVIDKNNNQATNIIGAEGRFYLNSNIALTLSGGFIYSDTPYSLAIPAIINEDSGETVIPGYNAVVADQRTDFNIAVGALYFFKNKNKRLYPYAGLLVSQLNARRSLYDPTIEDGAIKNLGNKHVEIVGLGIQAIAGVDYYLNETIYLGLSIKPLSFISTTNTKYPGPGLYSRKIQNNSLSSFVQPLISLGVKL